MSFRSDGWLPHYIDKATVASGGTVTGAWVFQNAASGVSVQVVCAGGAAGSLNIDCCNQDGHPQTYITTVTQAVPANGTGYFSFSLTDQLTSFARMRCRFTATAGGNVTVALNIRRVIP